MLKSTKVLPGAIGFFLAAAVLLVMPALTVAENSVNDEIQRCASVDDASTRLACYDSLAGRQESTPATVATAAPTNTAAQAPPDELGADALRRREGNVENEAPVATRVIRCVKDARKDYTFYLEGGQVWKQVSEKKLYYRDCDFNVTISRDFFGYKMQVEGEKGRFRVTRIR